MLGLSYAAESFTRRLLRFLLVWRHAVSADSVAWQKWLLHMSIARGQPDFPAAVLLALLLAHSINATALICTHNSSSTATTSAATARLVSLASSIVAPSAHAPAPGRGTRRRRWHRPDRAARFECCWFSDPRPGSHQAPERALARGGRPCAARRRFQCVAGVASGRTAIPSAASRSRRVRTSASAAGLSP